MKTHPFPKFLMIGYTDLDVADSGVKSLFESANEDLPKTANAIEVCHGQIHLSF